MLRTAVVPSQLTFHLWAREDSYWKLVLPFTESLRPEKEGRECDQHVKGGVGRRAYPRSV